MTQCKCPRYIPISVGSSGCAVPRSLELGRECGVAQSKGTWVDCTVDTLELKRTDVEHNGGIVCWYEDRARESYAVFAQDTVVPPELVWDSERSWSQSCVGNACAWRPIGDGASK